MSPICASNEEAHKDVYICFLRGVLASLICKGFSLGGTFTSVGQVCAYLINFRYPCSSSEAQVTLKDSYLIGTFASLIVSKDKSSFFLLHSPRNKYKNKNKKQNKKPFVKKKFISTIIVTKKKKVFFS